MAVVGAFVRVEAKSSSETWDRLGAIAGVEPFMLPEPEKIGVLIETGTLNEAHAILTEQVARTAGVLGAWPVSAHFEEDEPSADADQVRSR